MDTINFVTFGDSKVYGQSVKRLEDQARSLGVFTDVWAWTENDLAEDFRRQHLHFMRYTRGFGYWIWKPKVILQALEATPDNGFVVYADSGCEFNASPEAMTRLREYIEMARNSKPGIMGFTLPFIERQFTKIETALEALGDTDIETFNTVMNSAQRVGGINVWHKTPASMAFVREWLDICTRDNYRFVTDEPSLYVNAPDFIEHRHDQSIFSILSKKYDIHVIPDETYHADWHTKNWPIHAARIK